MHRLFRLAPLVMLLGGCASYAWVKPDATPEVTARDDAACRAEARDVAMEYAYGRVGPAWGYPPYQRPYPSVDPGYNAAGEQRVYERCMRNRGYDLVRTDKKS
jgi:hypothetical protein